ncbi:MAG: HAMP domain-containing protein [Gammaproteobacteria bacterium]
MQSFLLWINRHIATKLIGGTLLVIAVVFAVANIQAIRKEQTVLLDQMNSQGALLARVASKSCIEPLLIQDYPVLETIAELMTESEVSLSFVRIERQDGKIVAEAPAGTSVDPVVLASSRTYSSPIKINPDDISSIGRLFLGISTKQANDFITERIWSLVQNAVITFVAITIFLFFFLRQLVSEPLIKLDGQASDLGKGNLESPITISSKDEIGRLAVTFDNMRQELSKSSKLIIEQNEKLEERVKELDCLYGLSRLASRPDITLEEICQGTVDLIPPGWQYPDATCGRVVFEGKEFKTDNFQITPWGQSAEIKVHGKRAGTVEVCYLEEKPEADEGLSLKEEGDLIEALPSD